MMKLVTHEYLTNRVIGIDSERRQNYQGHQIAKLPQPSRKAMIHVHYRQSVRLI